MAIELCFVSECVAETKNQDRASLVRQDDRWIAVLCDGTAQSMHSADAATIATLDPIALWTEHGVSDVVARLHERRAALIAEANDEEPDESSFLSRAFAEILRDARQAAFQTTFVTARVTPIESQRFAIEAKSVGDSALLIFDGGGHLVDSNLKISGSDGGFGHASPITEVLPDHFRTDDVTLRTEVDAGAHIVLCSDGFYDAFATPGELFQWLLDHQEELRGEQRQAIVDALHERLDKRTGDDDLSFIWLSPRTAPEAEAVPAAVMSNASANARPSRIAAFIRRLRALVTRFLPRGHGESTS